MFQRFQKGLDSFLDTKIAEEQARQGQQPKAPPGTRRNPSAANARRSSGKTEPSAARRPGGSKLKVQDGDTVTIPPRTPDPDDFIIGDDVSDLSRAATPLPVKEDANGPVVEEKGGEEEDKDKVAPDTEAVSNTVQQEATSTAGNGKEAAPAVTEDELPEDVRKKLAKLETLTTRYQDLLRNYRTAHARVAAIEPFEATLREYTSLTSITDPGALVEFLDQRNVQSDMVKEEFRRVSAENQALVKERDTLKSRLEEAEKKAKDAFDEAAGLRKERKDAAETVKPAEVEESAAPSSNPDKEEPPKETRNTEDETFFSYETELPRLESEVEQQKGEIAEQRAFINELSDENVAIKHALDACQVDLDAMKYKVSFKEHEIADLQKELKNAKEQAEEAKRREAEAQGLVNDLPEQYRQPGGAPKTEKDIQREDKTKQVSENVVTALRERVKQAEDEKKIADGRVKELQFEINRMESEANASGEVITRLRGHEEAVESWKKKVVDLEAELDEANKTLDSKKGHEAAVASLRGQLKRAEKDRDNAYQSILDCGKCATPSPSLSPNNETGSLSPVPPSTGSDEPNESNRSTETGTPKFSISEPTEGSSSTQPTEVSAPTQPGNDGELAVPDTKKKKKKKSKAKKKDESDVSPADLQAPAPPATASAARSTEPRMSVKDLVANPARMQELVLKHGIENFAPDHAAETFFNALEQERQRHEEEIQTHERAIAEKTKALDDKDAEITTLTQRIGVQESLIERLHEKLKGEEGLREEIETLRESITEAGSESVDAKHELKTLREEKEKLQAEFDALKAENSRGKKSIKDAEAHRDSLMERCRELGVEIEELKRAQATSTASAAELQALNEKLDASEKAKEALRVAKEACEKQIEELRAQHTATGAQLGAKHQSLSRDFDGLKSRATGLETDLAAANQLAQTRFKDLTDLREHLNKLQPELKRLRREAEELVAVKTDLEKANGNVKKLETKEKDLKYEIAEYKSESTSLKEKIKKSDERNSALEDTYERTRKDLEQNERTRDEAVEKREKAQADLRKVAEELKTSKASLEDLQKQVNSFRSEATALRDEMQLKSAQQASAQSLVDSMHNQSRELMTQMKEITGRNESLEEELGDAHRLLSERGREGETMRRLLADVEGRAESKVKEAREKMDLAAEERDRAEFEASNITRKKGREIEDLKSRLRDAEREFGRATEAREDAERREHDFRRRRDDLERRASQAQEELAEVKTAMTQLRDALDEGERQSRELEKQKSELRKTLDEREARLEKLQKSSRSMAEELRGLQAAGKVRGAHPQHVHASARSSTDSSPRVNSPVPRSSGVGGAANGQGQEIDTAYLKNILLQFLEQKEKKHQMQLVPVLGVLLHFDKQDEQKWMSAISTR